MRLKLDSPEANTARYGLHGKPLCTTEVARNPGFLSRTVETKPFYPELGGGVGCRDEGLRDHIRIAMAAHGETRY